jgi:hypothetical protein
MRRSRRVALRDGRRRRPGDGHPRTAGVLAEHAVDRELGFSFVTLPGIRPVA